jgi:tetratricopeptide (TPR) repeat protein
MHALVPVVVIVIVGACATLLTVLLYRVLGAPRRVSALAALIKQGRTRQAIAGAKRILVRSPGSTDARYLLALAYLKDDRPELALIEMRAINDSGRFTDFCVEYQFRRQIAELFERFGHLEDALKEYLLLLKAAPQEPDYAFRVAELLEKRGNTDKAAGFYARAIKQRPAHAESHARLGCLLYRAKKTAEARESLEAATRLDPGNSTACYYLGRILREEGDPAAALRSLEIAARDPACRARALLEAGGCSLTLGDTERAIADLKRSLKASEGSDDGTVAYARYFLGLAYEAARDYDKAVEQWELVRAARPNFRDVADKIAEYRELRREDGVKDYLTAGTVGFRATCRKVVEAMGLEFASAQDVPDGCEIQARDPPTGMVQRRLTHLLRFLRGSRPVDEAKVRDFLERMRAMKAERGVIASSSGFSPRAVAFSQTRPIELVDHDRLAGLLRSAGGA